METRWFGIRILLVVTVWEGSALSAENDFTTLFNGKDLTGWVRVNVAPDTFTVKDGMIVCNGIPTGELRTERMYENFILELEYRHMKPKGNAGVFIWADDLTAPGQPFIRGIEVQVLDGRNSENYTSHGDVFPIHGATMKPDRPHPGGWNRCLPSENPCGLQQRAFEHVAQAARADRCGRTVEQPEDAHRGREQVEIVSLLVRQ